jgi:hypothetical protein
MRVALVVVVEMVVVEVVGVDGAGRHTDESIDPPASLTPGAAKMSSIR